MKKIPFKLLAEQVLVLYDADQRMRERVINHRGRWNARVDDRSSQFIKHMLPYVGWPGRSMIGIRASRALALLIRHADHNVNLQERCLGLMLALVHESPGEVALSDIAGLTDRICVNRKMLQIYGTQFNEVGGKFIPRPIFDRRHINRRRQHMGLGTLKEATAEMYRRYGAPVSA